MRKNIDEYALPRSKWIEIINEWVFDERDRQILIRKLLDGVSFERLAEEVDMSERQIKNIVYKHIEKIIKHT